MTRMPFHLGPRTLSTRVFWLTVSIIFVVDLLVMMPGMGWEWQSCLNNKVTQAELAATVIAGQAASTLANLQTRDALSNLSGTVAITLMGRVKEISILPARTPLQLDPNVDLDRASLWQSAWQADREVFGFCAPYLPVNAAFPIGSTTRIQIIVNQRPVMAHLRGYVARTVTYSVIVAVLTGGLVYGALDRLLVKPMRIMTANIVAFRRDPEYARLNGLEWLSRQGDDEISRAARELVIMQDELRTALWRNAQLAALGTAIAKISHDLRNILASALLVAGRFQASDDPAIKQASSSLISSMERAVELVTRTLDSAGGRPPPVSRSPVVLSELVDEVADFIRQGETRMAIENLVPANLVLPLDRNQIYRVLVNLLRNAAEAQASRAILTIEAENGVTQLVVTDNGPGLPRKALAGLFRPFAGSGRNGGTGLGLAIARDLIRTHGGDLLLRKTGPAGTEFIMSLPIAEAADAETEQTPVVL
jgi:signal transduction histidine kinase